MTEPCRPLPWAYGDGMTYASLRVDDTPNPAGLCPAVYPGGITFQCTEDEGHEGNHRAGDGDRIVAEWEA